MTAWRAAMEAKDVFTLGLGLSEPWKLCDQRLDVEKRPHELHLEVASERGALFPCPECGRACKAHDFAVFTWQHLNFFQHHCFITARVPRVDCPDHGVKRVTVPWARADSRFTLLFYPAATPWESKVEGTYQEPLRRANCGGASVIVERDQLDFGI